MPEVEIEVIFCPNAAFQGEAPLPSWPRVPGVQVTLTNGKGGGVTHDFLETGANGRTNSLRVGQARYQVSAAGVPPLWAQATTTVSVTPATQLLQVILVPERDLQLVRWELTYYDPSRGSGPLPNAQIQILADDGFNESFSADAKGQVSALAPLGNTTVNFQVGQADGTQLLPPNAELMVPVQKAKNPQPRPVEYAPEIQLTVSVVLDSLSGDKQPLVGAAVTLDLAGRSLPAQAVSKDGKVTFSGLAAGTYGITTNANTEGLTLVKPSSNLSLQPGDTADVIVNFQQERKIVGRVETEDGKAVTQNIRLEIYGGDDGPTPVTASGGTFQRFVEGSQPLHINVAPGQHPEIEGIPLALPDTAQNVSELSELTIVRLDYEHAITGRAIDDHGKPVPSAKIDIFDAEKSHIGTVEADPKGRFIFGVREAGDYFIAQHLDGDGGPAWEKCEVHSNAQRDVVIRTGLARTEAMTDLSAYPVLTEEVSTIGPPAPVAGGPGGGGGGAGAGYGQAVNQVMRDVLGWRPSNDVAGFQAALTGAFQLREAKGHTEWTWQQRGYSVQADMGALRGAQASIYARAKAALDQIQPLLVGVTALNPTLYPPEDLEAIRTVITAELAELVSELAWPGGPRTKRVDQLFRLLVGESRKSSDPNPDHVQGQLGTMRARFGLTEEWVDTIDEEQVLTNFRVVVEQVLSLQESWFYDRKLLEVVDSNSALGTILIWLSRGLEAVCESVDDLTFSLDSVFVDAAQRQVIYIKVQGQPPILLSDLLDWVLKAAKDEGPKLIQDAGRDGVDAFAPVLRELRTLVEGTRRFIRTPNSTVPDGMKTPRVHRAFQVLEAQLTEASRLARLVEKQSHDQAPQISTALAATSGPGEITITMEGINFRKNFNAFLLPADREDIADVPTRYPAYIDPSHVSAKFRIPQKGADGPGVTWQIVITNEDGTQSAPANIQMPDGIKRFS